MCSGNISLEMRSVSFYMCLGQVVSQSVSLIWRILTRQRAVRAGNKFPRFVKIYFLWCSVVWEVSSQRGWWTLRWVSPPPHTHCLSSYFLCSTMKYIPRRVSVTQGIICFYVFLANKLSPPNKMWEYPFGPGYENAETMELINSGVWSNLVTFR